MSFRLLKSAVRLAHGIENKDLSLKMHEMCYAILENILKDKPKAILPHEKQEVIKLDPNVDTDVYGNQWPNNQEVMLCRQGKKLDAVKSYKERTGRSLMDSKRIIEYYCNAELVANLKDRGVDHTQIQYENDRYEDAKFNLTGKR